MLLLLAPGRAEENLFFVLWIHVILSCGYQICNYFCTQDVLAELITVHLSVLHVHVAMWDKREKDREGEREGEGERERDREREREKDREREREGEGEGERGGGVNNCQ